MQEDTPLFSSATESQDPVTLDQRQQLRKTFDPIPLNLTLNGPASMSLHENEDMRTQATSGNAASKNDEASRFGDDRAKLDEAASTQLATDFEDSRTEMERIEKVAGMDSTEPALPTSFEGFVAEFLQKDSKWGEYNEENWKIIPRQTFIAEKHKRDNLWNSTCIRWPKSKGQGFPQFMELPTELRWKIWELVLPEPRVVRMRDDKTEDTRFTLCYGKSSGDIDVEKCPLQFACQDSWTVFTQNYQQLRVWSKKRREAPTKIGYFDYVRDTLLLSGKCLRADNGARVYTTKVRNLALAPNDDYRQSPPQQLQRVWKRLSQRFPLCKSLTIVPGKPDTAYMPGSPCRLIEVGDLELARYAYEYGEAARERESTVASYLDCASTWQKVFREGTRSQWNWWKFVEFKVSILSEGDPDRRWWAEPIRLTPKRPLPYEGQQFYTLKRISRSSTILCIHAQGLFPKYAKCRLDGALCNIYDGIKELFEEREEGRNSSNEALAIRVDECCLQLVGSMFEHLRVHW